MREATPGRSRLARVVSVGRNAAWISFEDEGDRVRLAALRKTLDRERLAPGDLVVATPLEDERVIVERREARVFALERTTAGGRTKTMAANIDALAIVAAFERPPLHFAMLDELLAFAEIHELGVLLVLTKPDLVEPVITENIVALYRERLGYSVFVVNSKQNIGVDQTAHALEDRHAILIGQSGVGKSSLYTALGGTADVGEVSKIGRGKQTTTTGRLHRFRSGWLIDSPGVGEFELRGYDRAAIAAGFIEFARAAPCRFTDCSHRAEPGCGVRDAAAAGVIARSRYESYLAILKRPVADPETWA